MKFVMKSMAMGLLLIITCDTFSLHAQEPLTGRKSEVTGIVRSTVAPNAAGIYWQAFSAMPVLKDEQKKSFETATASITAPLTADLDQTIAQFGVALHELHRARFVEPCDWQLDTEAGPHLLMTHLQKARDLSRVALLRARMRFAAGKTDAAISDILDVYKLARDCGCQPILISFLVNVAIEKVTNDVLTAHLPLLTPVQLDRLTEEIRRLPSTSEVVTCIQWEERLFGDWLANRINHEVAKLNAPQVGGKVLQTLGIDAGFQSELEPKEGDAEAKRKADILLSLTVEEVRASLQQLRADYAELGAIAALPFSEQSPRLKKLEESLAEARKLMKREDAVRYFSTTLLPTLSNVLNREEQFRTRQALLEQAISMQRHGVSTPQPVRTHPVDYRKTENGFELRCRIANEEISLEVGPAS